MDCTNLHVRLLLLLLLLLSLVSTILLPASAYCRPRNSHHFSIVPLPAPSPVPSAASKLGTLMNTETTPAAAAAAAAKARSLPPIPGIHPATIKSICMRTTYPSLCESSVNPYLSTAPIQSSSSNPTTSSVLSLLLKAAKSQTATVVATFGQLAKTAAPVAEVLNDCKGRYVDALDNYDAAMAAVEKGDIATAAIDLSAVLEGYDACGGGDAPGDPTLPGVDLWTVYNAALTKIADNCLDLCAVLE